MQANVPQDPGDCNLLENVTVDKRTLAWSTRVGYEKYRPNPTTLWSPFSGLKRVDSLFVAQGLAGGARQTILLESGGAMYLFHEVGQENVLVKLYETTQPSATDSPTVFTQFNDRVIATNGRDAPRIIRLWPLPESAYISDDVLDDIVRPLGFQGNPPAPEALAVSTIQATASADNYTGSSTSNWYPVFGVAISYPSYFGLGVHYGGTDGASNDFQFRLSFVSDTGSESGLSIAATASWDIEASAKGYRYCPTLRLPTGPQGTVARKLYGTTNEGGDFFFVDIVRNNSDELYHVTRRDTSFSVAAPADSDSAPFPAPYARVCAVFKDCVFLDGGRGQGNLLFFSHPGLPDQFGAADYITLTGGGGAIVALYPYYNNLVIFRENGIDVLTGSFPDFSVQTVTSQVACRAPASVDAVPSIGVVFLATDGVYALDGGLDGGSVMQVQPIGLPIRKQLSRLTVECSARAVGRYCPIERAYHLYLPVDGNDRPNLGAVLHVDKGWSLRTGFPVGCLDRTFTGHLVFGHHTGVEAGLDKEAGLFVLTGRRAMGGVADEQATYVLSAPPTSILESAWLDFGDAQTKKQVTYVTLWVLTTGSVSLDLTHFKDFEEDAVGKNGQYLSQPPDRAAQPVYDTATWNSAKWTEPRLVPIRIPVAQQSCSWFKWRVETTDDLLVVGFEVEYTARGTITTAGRT
jgi:hypothetical protein